MLHLDALTAAQREALAVIAPVASAESFYLAGGCGLALHLGHRLSVDLDMFRREPLADPLVLARRLKEQRTRFTTTSRAEGTLHGRCRGVPISFMEYRYPFVRRVVAAGLPCRIASVEDIGCMKLAAIVDRGAKKDFVDLHFILRRVSLSKLLQDYRKKFAVEDTTAVRIALAYFDDAEPHPMPAMIADVNWDELKASIRESVRALR
ncbi:MAG: nucleotidyl transferase AbiEii/AbiGii toxin family protein [Planctomycetes bacterium]|nr:nucleotidyl transferase AbiEii/AbiGii toxin family protein [Planctomycetota bacterium]